MYFCDDSSGKAKKIIVQVKSGHVNVSHVRDLLGVIESACADIGVLLTLKTPTKPMLDFAYAAGYYNSQYGHFPKIQILTIAELLDG
ncbi:restriction endonuclease [Desulfitibacter alkalitolerans]|uniref:restriction endonuclease n=1 Tax=Desulfitibacter alkalitolerans TaxID=264641 RepID=UPI001FA719A9